MTQVFLSCFNSLDDPKESSDKYIPTSKEYDYEKYSKLNKEIN